jgi:hypothetical protein
VGGLLQGDPLRHLHARSAAPQRGSAALLTYELPGGETKKDGEVKRWFKPVNGLGDAGNSILYRGLQGSPLFESSGCFFHKLKSAIQSGDGGPRTFMHLRHRRRNIP